VGCSRVTRVGPGGGSVPVHPVHLVALEADGNGDGVADPQNIGDAALAAGRYLCAGGKDLATGAGWWQAILSYNNSVIYVQNVFAAADGYAPLQQTGAGRKYQRRRKKESAMGDGNNPGQEVVWNDEQSKLVVSDNGSRADY